MNARTRVIGFEATTCPHHLTYMQAKPLSFFWCPDAVSFFNGQDADELLWLVYIILRPDLKKKEKEVLRYIETKNDYALKSSNIMNQKLCLIL